MVWYSCVIIKKSMGGIVIAKKNIVFKLEMLILICLIKKDCYGYEISSMVKEQTKGILEIKEGVLYPLLHNLLNSEYISTFDKIVNKKVRVYYHIEPTGKLYLTELIDDYTEKIEIINQIINEMEK